MNKGISSINNLTKFIHRTSGCSREQSKRVANQYTSKLQHTSFSCDLKKYDDAIPINRVYNNFLHTYSIIGKNHPVSQKLDMIRQFLKNAVEEETYLNRKL